MVDAIAQECLPRVVSKDIKLNGDIGVSTKIIIQIFVNRVFITLTNFNKFGSIVECLPSISVINQKLDFRVKTLLGPREDVVNDIYARQLTEKIIKMEQFRNPTMFTLKPLLLAVALKEEMRTPESFRSLIDEVVGMYEDLTRSS